MRRFARAGNKVIFVNSISMGMVSVRHKDFLPRVTRKLRSYAKLARTTEEGITVVSPAVIPFFGSGAAQSVNQRLLAAQIGTLSRSRGLTHPILWIAIPTAVQMVGRLNESLVIYQVSDKYDANTMDHAVDPSVITKLHNRALDTADIIFYSSRKLFDEAERGRERSYLLEQAVDFEHWSRVENDQLAVPPEIAAISRPRLGYFGAIEPWLIDQELIKRAATEHPDWQWVFIGNKSRGIEVESLPNTHFIPPVAYDNLPNYAAGFDVCVLPWDTEKAFTSYGSAIKVREYMATGKPVVISPLPEYESMRSVLRIAGSRDDFLLLIQDALNENDPKARARRQSAVKDGTWDARAEFVSHLIEKALLEKSK